MNATEHLTAEETDLLVIGEVLPADRAAHLGSCLVCRRRHAALAAAFAGAAVPEPRPETMARVRSAALAALGHERRQARRWLAAAAVLLLTAVAAVFLAPRSQAPPFDADAVLLQVDEVLARDPLAAFADEAVVEAVVADGATASDTSQS
jgi:hypothetical protein